MTVRYRLLLLTILALSITPPDAFAAYKKVIVGFHRLPDLQQENRIYRARGRVRHRHKLIPAISAEIPAEEVASLKNDPSVAYVEEDIRVSLVRPVLTQSAPSPEYADSWGVQRIGAETAVARGITGAGVKVAILDTGIDYNHPDLKDNYKGGYNFVFANTDPYDDSTDSHGTHVAGIIGARNNGTGVVGVAPEASLYALKVLDGAGFGDLSWIIAGIEWSIQNKMDVINISAGTGSLHFQSLQDACDMAYKAGIVLVAAAGNSGVERVDYPAGYDSVIAVSATDQNDQRALFPLGASNTGDKIELAAPGIEIRSTVSGGGYSYLSGTSQAAPHVAGAAALMFSSGILDKNGDGSRADEVRQLLDSTAKDLGDAGRDTIYGYGLVDVSAATVPVWTQLLTVSRTGSSGKKDVTSLELEKGTYSVSATNHGLKKLTGHLSLDGGSEQDFQAFSLLFKKSLEQTATAELVVSGPSRLEITPIGQIGAFANIVLTKTVR